MDSGPADSGQLSDGPRRNFSQGRWLAEMRLNCTLGWIVGMVAANGDDSTSVASAYSEAMAVSARCSVDAALAVCGCGISAVFGDRVLQRSDQHGAGSVRHHSCIGVHQRSERGAVDCYGLAFAMGLYVSAGCAAVFPGAMDGGSGAVDGDYVFAEIPDGGARRAFREHLHPGGGDRVVLVVCELLSGGEPGIAADQERAGAGARDPANAGASRGAADGAVSRCMGFRGRARKWAAIWWMRCCYRMEMSSLMSPILRAMGYRLAF